MNKELLTKTILSCILGGVIWCAVDFIIGMINNVSFVDTFCTTRNIIELVVVMGEKAMGAYLAGVKKVIIPADNVPDLDEVDDVVKANVAFVSVESLHEVFEHAFAVTPKKVQQEQLLMTPKNSKRAELRQ